MELNEEPNQKWKKKQIFFSGRAKVVFQPTKSSQFERIKKLKQTPQPCVCVGVCVYMFRFLYQHLPPVILYWHHNHYFVTKQRYLFIRFIIYFCSIPFIIGGQIERNSKIKNQIFFWIIKQQQQQIFDCQKKNLLDFLIIQSFSIEWQWKEINPKTKKNGQ